MTLFWDSTPHMQALKSCRLVWIYLISFASFISISVHFGFHLDFFYLELHSFLFSRVRLQFNFHCWSGQCILAKVCRRSFLHLKLTSFAGRPVTGEIHTHKAMELLWGDYCWGTYLEGHTWSELHLREEYSIRQGIYCTRLVKWGSSLWNSDQLDFSELHASIRNEACIRYFVEQSTYLLLQVCLG